MNKFFGIVALAGIAAAVNAQTATYTWQVSNDNGVTWGASTVGTAGVTVKVRVLASWAGVTGTDQGYAGGQFDATLTGAVAGDVVSNILRPSPFAFAAQTLAATAFAGGQKIDTAADILAPGAGTGWVNPGQPAKDFAPPGGYNSTNGAVVFTYDVLCSGLNQIAISSVLNVTAGRAMAVYTAAGGSQARISAPATTIVGATILIPTPGALALLGLGGLAVARRRR